MTNNPDLRAIGLETEFGVWDPGDPQANAIAISAAIVQAYANKSRAGLVEAAPVRWDYGSEDPLADLRGYRMERANAHPSQLTDRPESFAPPIEGSSYVEASSLERHMSPASTSVVVANGARFYVDHAHPEYSSPEVATPLDAVLYDRAGEVIGRRAMASIAELGHEIVLVKNNTDGKGQSYGAHENYLVPRSLPFDVLVDVLTPFLITRPIVCGAGRVGLGMRSSEAGFQISARADFVESAVGLQTTFDRPIINTRDEPHASEAWRRLHIINGDANLFDVSTYLRVGTTAAVLWMLEDLSPGVEADLGNLRIEGDPVPCVAAVSRDLSLKKPIMHCADGQVYSSLDMQQRLCLLVKQEMTRRGYSGYLDDVVRRWDEVLENLDKSPHEAAHQVEWCAKLRLFDAMRERMKATWSHPKLAAMDLQWADLRPHKSLVEKLDQSGLVERLFTREEVQEAVNTPPKGTRAQLRGCAVAHLPQLRAASWNSLVVEHAKSTQYLRLPLGDPGDIPQQELLAACRTGSLSRLLEILSAKTGEEEGQV
ncbi:MAG: depupylase/deamidase Dop [Actinomycetaceae bacterium]|nr:depupylase/deamidase Dop [Actinomycetaceae bacterium]